MAKFKVGDKVHVKAYKKRPYTWNCEGDMDKWIGKVVTIAKHRPRENDYVIKEDQEWYFEESDFEPIKPFREFIVIRRDGAKTIAELRHDREVIKSGTAICNASDAFDFDTGAKLAFDRLMGREEPKPEPQPARRFKVGDRVEHKTHGFGSILHDDKAVFRPYLVLIEKDIDKNYRAISTNGITNEENCVWANESDLSPAPEPPKFYTGKVVCISNSSRLCQDDFVVGKTYSIIDGNVEGNAPWFTKQKISKIESIKQLNDGLFGTVVFVEAKE